MTYPDRCEASAVDLEHLAAHPETSDRERVAIASALCFVPLTHPSRITEDRVLAMTEAIRRRQEPPWPLLDVAAELRAGAAEMMQTGWTKTLHGGKP